MTQPTTGGAALQVWQLASMMDREKFRVTVGSPGSGWLRMRVLASGAEYREIEFVREISPLRDLQALFAVLRLVRRERPQVIHAHSSKAGILGRLAGVLCRVPVVVYTPHGFPFRQSSGLSSRMYLWLERWFALFADRIICVSESERADALRHRLARHRKLVVISNGVDIPQEHDRGQGTLRGLLGVGEATRVVAMVSRLRRPKSPEDLVRAAAIVTSKVDEMGIRFVFIGDGPLQGSTQELARELGLEVCVTFLGDRNDVPALIPDFDVVVLASTAEGMPYSILEAMAAGKPVVGSRVPGLEDLIIDGKNGFCYTPGDPVELADALLRLLDDQQLRRRLGDEGRRMAASAFTADRMVRETQELYGAVLRDKIGSTAMNEGGWP